MSISWENTVVKTQEFSADTIINGKIKAVVTGLPKNICNLFFEFLTDHDKELVADFLDSCLKQENMLLNTKRSYLIALAYLARAVKKPLEIMTSSDLKTYLESMQRSGTEDPDQSWIATQKTMGWAIKKFFKWLAYPDLTPQERKHLPPDKPLPPVLRGVVFQTKKGSKSPIKAKDIWNDKDTAVFLKYCTEDRRLRFYHALAIETSGRPGELLQLKIRDFSDIQSDEIGNLYVALDIGRHGKTKQSRIVGITDFTVQYYKEYLLHQHPDATNKEVFVFVSQEYSALSKNLPISGDTLRHDYAAFRKKDIPKLLKRPDIPQADKEHLQLLKEEKKWSPYTMRHSSITQLARHPKINDYVLRQHCGWSKSSNMVEIYTHDLKGDSLEYVMEARGINIKNKRDKDAQLLRKELVGPHCIYCKMVNVPNSQFCSSCQRPITPVSYDSIIRESENVKKELAELKAQRGYFESRQEQMEKKMQQWEERQEEIFEQIMREKEPELKKIKSEKKRNAEESQLLWDAGAAAEVEVEDEFEEKEAAKRAAAVKIEYDEKGNPISTTHDNIDWNVEEEYDAEDLGFSERMNDMTATTITTCQRKLQQ